MPCMIVEDCLVLSKKLTMRSIEKKVAVVFLLILTRKVDLFSSRSGCWLEYASWRTKFLLLGSLLIGLSSEIVLLLFY